MSITKKSAPQPKPRRRRAAADAKEAILDAAEALLNTDGPQQLKLVSIAKAAKVTNGNVLHHFQSVEMVQEALMTRLVGRLVERVLKITQSPWTEDQRMTLAIQEMFEAFEDKSASRLAAWLVMTDRTDRLDEIKDAIASVLTEIQAVRAKGPRAHLDPALSRQFMLLGILNALAAGLFGRKLSRLMDLPDRAARDAALWALLTLAAQQPER
jgi:AcrR family transcriptional regulator